MNVAIPLEDNVLVRVLPVNTQLGVGLILPDHVANKLGKGKNDKPYKGVVVAVGPGRVMDDGSMRPVELEPGQTVIFDYYTGHDRVQHHGEEVAVVKEHDIKVVL